MVVMTSEKTPPDSSALVLVSGGVESTALLHDCLGRYEAVTPVYLQNHLYWEAAEIFCLKRLLRETKSPKLRTLKVLDFSVKDVYENHWSVSGTRVPGADSPDAAVYLPGRNILFLAKASVYAASRGIPHIEIGILRTNPFSDGTARFLKKMSDALTMGLSRPVHVHAPFAKLRKEDVLLRAKRLPLELTFSCINPKGYEHCGDCNKCVERKKAFFAAGLPDRTRYKKAGLSM